MDNETKKTKRRKRVVAVVVVVVVVGVLLLLAGLAIRLAPRPSSPPETPAPVVVTVAGAVVPTPTPYRSVMKLYYAREVYIRELPYTVMASGTGFTFQKALVLPPEVGHDYLRVVPVDVWLHGCKHVLRAGMDVKREATEMFVTYPEGVIGVPQGEQSAVGVQKRIG